MSNAVQAQHPAVVLRSSYQHLRALLAIAAIAIVGLTVTVVVLALNNSRTTTASPPAHTNPSAITDYPGHY
jgi:hypothetical protein